MVTDGLVTTKQGINSHGIDLILLDNSVTFVSNFCWNEGSHYGLQSLMKFSGIMSQDIKMCI